MKLYTLLPSFYTGGDLISVPDPKGRIFDFFILNQGDGTFLKYTTPKLQAQERIKLDRVATADYLPAVIGVPIFSEKAKNAFINVFPNEIQIYECFVDCQGSKLKFYLCRTLKFLSLINKKKSHYSSLTDGSPILDEPVFYENVKENFFIARDNIETVFMCVSQCFVDLCMTEKLKIAFSPVKQM